MKKLESANAQGHNEDFKQSWHAKPVEYVKLDKRFYGDSGRTRRDGSEGHKDGFKVFRDTPRVSKVSVDTVLTTNACDDENGSKHRWPQSHCNSDGTPSAGETPLLEVSPEVRPESFTPIVQSGTSLAMDATECDVSRGFLPSSVQEPTPVIADIWLP